MESQGFVYQSSIRSLLNLAIMSTESAYWVIFRNMNLKTKVYRCVQAFCVTMSRQTPPSIGGKVSRRDFLKLMAAAGTVLTFVPFVDWGKFLPNPSGKVAEKAKVELPDGTPANIKTFPVNSSKAVIYPKTNDNVLNKESFRTWQFIRLPEELGGT